MKVYSIFLLSVVLLLAAVVHSTNENEGSVSRPMAAITEEGPQLHHLRPRNRHLSHNSKKSSRHSKKNRSSDDSESRSRSHSKKHSKKHSHKHSHKSPKQKSKSKKSKKHDSKKGKGHFDPPCDCDFDWAVETCENWLEGNLILTLEEEKCAEECCVSPPAAPAEIEALTSQNLVDIPEVETETSQNLIDVLNDGFDEDEGMEEEELAF